MQVPGLTKSDLELMPQVIRALVYSRVRKWRLTLVEMGHYFVGLGGSKKKERGNKEVFVLGQMLGVLRWLSGREMLEPRAGAYLWKEERIGEVAETFTYSKKIANEKMKIAVKIMRVMRHLPFIKMAAVCGTVAAGNAREKSDIDLLVITKEGRIWTTRFFMMLVLELMRRRKKKGRRANRICLNHFIAQDQLLVKYRDFYSALEYARMICLVNREAVLERFIKGNAWISTYLGNEEWRKEKYLPNYWEERVMDGKDSWVYKLGDRIFSGRAFDWLEKGLGFFQARRIERKRKKQKGGQVYWGADALIFHPKPKSIFFSSRYQEAMKKEEEKIRRLVREWKKKARASV